MPRALNAKLTTTKGMQPVEEADFKWAPRGTLCKAQMDLRASPFPPPSPSYHSTHSPRVGMTSTLIEI